MNNTFISPVIGRASELGVSSYEDSDRIEYLANSTPEEKEILIKAIYKQVLGNAYVMESERPIVIESQLKQGEISVRGFISALAKSDLYRSRFVDNCPRYRAIELNFKHFLGRAPESYEEMQFHSQILDNYGYEADVDSFIDSEEYQNKFGENVVPYYSGYKTQTGKSMVGFPHLFKLLRGASSSDKNLVKGNYSRLNAALISNSPSGVIPPSSSTSYGGVADVQQLIANALKASKSSSIPAAPSTQTVGYYQPPSSTPQNSSNDQEARIQELKQKLAELSTLANIGATSLNKWQQGQTSSIKAPQNRATALSPKQQIAELETQVADAQRLANFAETRLNRWRSKIFF